MKNIKLEKQKGFSLVELMVVIAIIAILAAVAIPMYSHYTTRAKIGNEISKVNDVKTDVANQIAIYDLKVGITMDNGITVSNDGYITGAAFTSKIPNGTILNSETGTITLSATSGADMPSDSRIVITPTIGNGGDITWTCTSFNLSSAEIPVNCK